jgi:hypothetical protein
VSFEHALDLVAQILVRLRGLVHEQTPIDATVRMPSSSINFVKQFVPALRDLDGSLALDVKVGGTIAHPGISGSANATINLARLDNATIPALTNFRAQLNFRDNTLNFDRCGGDLAGDGSCLVSSMIASPERGWLGGAAVLARNAGIGAGPLCASTSSVWRRSSGSCEPNPMTRRGRCTSKSCSDNRLIRRQHRRTPLAAATRAPEWKGCSTRTR